MAVNTTSSQEAVEPDGDKPFRRGTIVTVMILVAFVAILNQTLLNVAIPHLMTTFDVSADTIQ